ncbi:AAA family ATPase [Brachybacterium sp. NPDC056505]|uniref:AAA family ATPase n=1 Tax=Brachybacterium sp. NPDC056505 TaxID=3345843 RepID=UPI0036717552
MQTRKPTGRAPWPMLLLAGAEKAGKSWAAAEATGSDLIRNAYWLSIGEDDPDEYAQIPGADFQIVEHDGTYKAVLDTVREVAALPQEDGRPDLLIVDSMGRLWSQLSDMAQAEANERAAAKARKYGRNAPEDDVQIGMDLWNRAKGRWGDVLDALRSFPGPVILTARLSVVTVMDAEGKPTKETRDKVEAEKNLPYDVGAVVKLPERGVAILSGVRSTKLQMERPTKLQHFTVANLWEAMGVGADATPERSHAGQPTETPEATEARSAEQQWLDKIHAAQDRAALSRLFEQAKELGVNRHAGIYAAFQQRGADLDAEQPRQVLEGDVVGGQA